MGGGGRDDARRRLERGFGWRLGVVGAADFQSGRLVGLEHGRRRPRQLLDDAAGSDADYAGRRDADAVVKTDFAERVWAVVRRVPPGRVITYGEVARRVGGSARAVGQVMRHNTDAPRLPCHRVVGSNGWIGGYAGATAGKTLARKIALLRSEGAALSADGRRWMPGAAIAPGEVLPEE